MKACAWREFLPKDTKNAGCMRDYVNPGLLSELIIGIPYKLS